MSKLVIKTGMTVEQAIAQRYAAPGTLVLTGQMDAASIWAALPNDCEAILSFGVCGGLSPDAAVGQTFIYSNIVSADGTRECDLPWRRRMFAATHHFSRHAWSMGEGGADTADERAALFARTGCWIDDDESSTVAVVAHGRGIAFGGLRAVSDGAEDNLPPAVVDALNPDGSDDLEAVFASLVRDPLQIPALIKTALQAQRALCALKAACIAVGPNFQWE